MRCRRVATVSRWDTRYSTGRDSEPTLKADILAACTAAPRWRSESLVGVTITLLLIIQNYT